MLLDIFSNPESGMDILIMMLVIVALIGAPILLGIVLSRLKHFGLGFWGERAVARKLKHLGEGYEVYNDVLIRAQKKTTQIDHIVVSPFGIFVVETKNYQGWIFGKEDSYYWTQNLFGNKYRLYNPIKQNTNHIKALQKISPSTPTNTYMPIVVFTTRGYLRVSGKDNLPLIYSNQIVQYINSFTDVVLSKEQMEQFSKDIKQHRLESKEDRSKHSSYVSEVSSRQRAIVEAGKCPLCGGQLDERTGRYSRFLGCSNYPNCKFTANK